MKSVRPTPLAQLVARSLNSEDSHVLSRVDQRRSLREIADLAKLPIERVTEVVERLARQGVVHYVAPDEVPSRAAIPQADESGSYSYDALSEPVESTRDLLAREAAADAHYESYESSDEEGGVADHAAPAEDLFPEDAIPSPEIGEIVSPDDALYRAPESLSDFGHVSEALDTQDALPEHEELMGEIPPSVPRDAETLPELEELGPAIDSDAPPAIDGADTVDESDEGDAVAHASPEEKAEDEQAVHDEKNVRKLYETKFHKLETDQRMAFAGKASGLDLLALCLDHDPKVIAAVMANTGFALAHARLVAFHHRTGVGLDMLASRAEFPRDGLVFRRLIRNSGLGAATLRRLLQPKRLAEIYKVTLDRDVPDLARTNSRGLLRTKFTSQAQPEERAEIIINTEARVLSQLSGCTIDARTTQILCGRQTFSALFVQNVARFPAAPPNLLAHLSKIPFVKRNSALRKILMQHPNMPGDAKRNL